MVVEVVEVVSVGLGDSVAVGVGSSSDGSVVVVAVPRATWEPDAPEVPEAKEPVTGTAISAAAATPTAAPVSLRLAAGPRKRFGSDRGGNRSVTALTFLETITRDRGKSRKITE